MKTNDAIEALAALAHDTRLSVFRLLVKAGPCGCAAGDIAAALDVPAPTLSFHLRHLTVAGLIGSRRESRSIIYAVRFDGIRELLAFLMEDCCQGMPEACETTACCDSEVNASPCAG